MLKTIADATFTALFTLTVFTVLFILYELKSGDLMSIQQALTFLLMFVSGSVVSFKVAEAQA